MYGPAIPSSNRDSPASVSAKRLGVDRVDGEQLAAARAVGLFGPGDRGDPAVAQELERHAVFDAVVPRDRDGSVGLGGRGRDVDLPTLVGQAYADRLEVDVEALLVAYPSGGAGRSLWANRSSASSMRSGASKYTRSARQ